MKYAGKVSAHLKALLTIIIIIGHQVIGSAGLFWPTVCLSPQFVIGVIWKIDSTFIRTGPWLQNYRIKISFATGKSACFFFFTSSKSACHHVSQSYQWGCVWRKIKEVGLKILPLPFTSCRVMASKACLSLPQFPLLSNMNNASIHLTGFLWRENRIIHCKVLRTVPSI